MRASRARSLAMACLVGAAVPIACAPEDARSIHMERAHQSKVMLSPARRPAGPVGKQPGAGRKAAQGKVPRNKTGSTTEARP
jgi:hypothetical protein